MRKLIQPFGRLPFLGLALVSLLAALWAGLVRLGWGLPPLGSTWTANHGPLMINGVLGLLICLERAVAIAALFKTKWPYLLPLFVGLGAVAVLVGLLDIGRGLMTLSSVGLTAAYLVMYQHSPNEAHATMGLGALAWLIGNGLWLFGQPVYHAVPWWIGFLILTIAGERLELARIMILRQGTVILFIGSITLLVAGLGLSVLVFEPGLRLSGMGLIALGGWLLSSDIARKTIRQSGLPRFIAACLLPGYIWLILAGAAWLIWPDRFMAGFIYDAMLHSVLLGYVFSMIFGHAPIIFPAVLGVRVGYRPIFYLPLGLLHASLVLRILGDAASSPAGRQWGGLLNALAIVVFFAIVVYGVAGPRPRV